MSLLFKMLSRFVMAFLPRSKSLNFMAAVTVHHDFGTQENKICHCFYFFPFYLPWSDGTGCHDLSFICVCMYSHVYTFMHRTLGSATSYCLTRLNKITGITQYKSFNFKYHLACNQTFTSFHTKRIRCPPHLKITPQIPPFFLPSPHSSNFSFSLKYSIPSLLFFSPL